MQYLSNMSDLSNKSTVDILLKCQIYNRKVAEEDAVHFPFMYRSPYGVHLLMPKIQMMSKIFDMSYYCTVYIQSTHNFGCFYEFVHFQLENLNRV